MRATVHVADIRVSSALATLRKAPSAATTPGLRQANVALAAPLTPRLRPSPQLGRVALIAFWDDDDAIDRFNDSPAAAKFVDGWHARLEPLRAHGTWPGLDTDISKSRAVTGVGPVVVLTLGRLRYARAVPFLRASAKAEGAAVQAAGLIWGTGLARPPFVATCSLWESANASAEYAFGTAQLGHPEAINEGQAKPFHHQEAFIRFRPYAMRGALNGRNPLAAVAS